jgi:hypothetical protein
MTLARQAQIWRALLAAFVPSRLGLERYRASALFSGGRGSDGDEQPPRHELRP